MSYIQPRTNERSFQVRETKIMAKSVKVGDLLHEGKDEVVRIGKPTEGGRVSIHFADGRSIRPKLDDRVTVHRS